MKQPPEALQKLFRATKFKDLITAVVLYSKLTAVACVSEYSCELHIRLFHLQHYQQSG